ncbi:hypothetical protein [Sphingomonas sp. PB4P5]|uniref:hypothetical protein n=1 Tax=Parasphingomonas puruogangriensis TaxID=3096155 RepID=UPI002FCAA6B8
MSDWQPIETAPKDGTIVLLWACDEDEWDDAHDEPRDPERCWYPARVSVQKHIWWIAGGMMRQLKGATHWMPLPAPPATLEHAAAEAAEIERNAL